MRSLVWHRSAPPEQTYTGPKWIWHRCSTSSMADANPRTWQRCGSSPFTAQHPAHNARTVRAIWERSDTTHSNHPWIGFWAASPLYRDPRLRQGGWSCAGTQALGSQLSRIPFWTSWHRDWDAMHFHYMFCHTDLHDVEGTFLHSSHSRLFEVEVLQVLCQCGYLRAVVTGLNVN